MQLRQLRYFLAVAEHGSFTTAAGKIGVAQPALSAQVAKLEAALGCHLFDRHARGVRLTETGRFLRSEAIAILEHVKRAERETRLRGQSGPVACTIGLPPRAADLLTVPLVAEVAKSLPQVSLCILDAMGGVLREWYADGRLDLAVLYRIPDEPLQCSTNLIAEDFYLATAKASGLTLPVEVGVEELLAIPLIVSTVRNAHRQLLELVARRHARALMIAGEIDSVNAQRKLVLTGSGAAVLPFGDFVEWPTELLHIVPVRSEELTASLMIVRGPHVRDNPLAAAIERVLTELVYRLVADGTWRGARIIDGHDHPTQGAALATAADHFGRPVSSGVVSRPAAGQTSRSARP